MLVLGGLGAYYYFTQDDDEPAATTDHGAASSTSVEQVRVPDVVGTTSSEATATLRDAGFEANVVAVPSDRPSRQVVAQNPAAGKRRAGRLDGAAERRAASLARRRRRRRRRPLRPRRPPPATTAPPEPATVPDVVGKELADAARAFADEGLKVAVQYVPSDEPQGRVVAQAQPAGTELERGDTVQVNVSNGPEPGGRHRRCRTWSAAAGPRRATTLERAGFEVLAIELDGNRHRTT